LISIGRFTGLEGVVELLMFRIEGTGGGGVELPPDPQATSKAESAISTTAPTLAAHCRRELSCCVDTMLDIHLSHIRNPPKMLFFRTRTVSQERTVDRR
jgi:hypothetical protein